MPGSIEIVGAKGVGRPGRRKPELPEARLPRGPAEPQALHPALRMLNVGYGNLVVTSRVIAVISPQSSPMRRLREEASSRGKLVDATQGRRTRSILVTDSDHVILSALNPETIAARLAPAGGEGSGAPE
jgi:extracellular matrix regulatory protein A